MALGGLVPSMIKISLNPTESQVLFAPPLVLKELSTLCSYSKLDDRGKLYSIAYKNHQWDGKIYLLNKLTGAFPTGLIYKIIDHLDSKNYEYEIINNIPKSEEHPKLKDLAINFQLRDYQKDAIAAMLKYKRGVVQSPTGSGKTKMAVGLTAQLKRPLLFLVPSIDLLDQTIQAFQESMPGVKIGRIGDADLDPQLITVSTVQTLAGWIIPPELPKKTIDPIKYQKALQYYESALERFEKMNERTLKFLAQFPAVVYDEVHIVGADTFYAVAQACKGAEYLIGLSATPFRESGDELRIEAALGKIIYKISLSDLIEKGRILPADIHIHEYPDLPPMILPTQYNLQYKICVTENDHRNNKIIELVKQEAELGLSVLILAKEIAHINTLSEMMKTEGLGHEVLHGQVKKRAQVLENFKTGANKILIGSTVLDVGIDLPILESIILAGGGRSKIKVYQRIGRALRTGLSEPYFGDKRARIHDIKDKIKPFLFHYYIRNQIYKAEPAFKVIEHYEIKERKVNEKKIKNIKKLDNFNLDISDIKI